MDASWVVLILLAGVACQLPPVTGDVTASLCDDIDEQACHMMQSSKPDMCNDTALAQSACRRFCGLCPIECYHCDQSVNDYADCNTTKLCAAGEVCMVKQLDATRDGHREYSMTCEPQEACDGTGLTILFGKRDVHPRDLFIHCCSDDLCNYPAAPGTVPPYTGCVKDILFLVDEYSSQNHFLLSQPHMVTDALALITNLVTDMNVGPNAAQVALATYSRSVHGQFELDTYHTTHDVIHAISQVHLHTHHGGHHSSDSGTDEALTFLLHGAMTVKAGDRPAVPDVVVMITDSASVRDVHTMISASRLHRISHDVITIEIGLQNHDNDRGQLATDSAHAISVPSSQSLVTDAFKQQIQALICA